jgi:hypothetical protein
VGAKDGYIILFHAATTLFIALNICSFLVLWQDKIKAKGRALIVLYFFLVIRFLFPYILPQVQLSFNSFCNVMGVLILFLPVFFEV